MAVVQISRIQVRRGKGTNGIPQLAGGEFGWAVDSRALYIGNGSVAEGSPAVGNTKIITEHDDLFTLANTYTYLNGVSVQTGPSATAPVKRTLQERLDEIANIRSFGVAEMALQMKLLLYKELSINYTLTVLQKAQSKAESDWFFLQDCIMYPIQFTYHLIQQYMVTELTKLNLT